MNELPNKMPSREATVKAVVTKIPHIFNPWGTLLYSACSFTAFCLMVALPWWTPPWYILLMAFTYVFLSSGIIALGRIEGNNDARLFIEMLKHQDEENKRRMN